MKHSWNIPGAPGSLLSAVPFLAAAVLVLSFHQPGVRAQSSGEKTFASPGDAVLGLYTAVKKGDNATLDAIFGSQSAKILHTGDDVADKNAIDKFLRQYEQMHRVVIEPDQTATLYVGAANWPMPIALARNSGGQWYFDTGRGLQEMLYRRIGANEVDAIEVLHTLIGAQKEYASAPHDDGKTKQYAARLFSEEGKHNGLYWKTADNEAPSPIGPLLADASDEGYRRKQGQPNPFHGYIFRMLTRQGASAKGGAHDYMTNGVLTRGVAFVAYPAEYRNSGVMTFIVNQDDVVYEKDLGSDTARLAAAVTEYNPDNTWVLDE
ncbi:MAG TPA: DUF2950 domain-containing protein [Terracidiphilus sp.]